MGLTIINSWRWSSRSGGCGTGRRLAFAQRAVL